MKPMTVYKDTPKQAAARALLEMKPTPENPGAVEYIRMEDLPMDILQEMYDQLEEAIREQRAEKAD